MKLISYLCSVIIKQGGLIMKKNELIEKIEVLMRDNSGITFDTPEEIAGEELLSISYCGELSFADDVYSLLGVQYLYINENGKLRCDSMVVTSDEYLSNKCNFDKIYNEYWEKMFKCK